MKLAHHYESLKADMLAIIAHYNFDLLNADHGKTGLKAMWSILNAVLFDRAYDDFHPAFTRGRVRVLPFDGRDHGFWYKEGADDSHMETLLRKIKKDICSTAVK